MVRKAQHNNTATGDKPQSSRFVSNWWWLRTSQVELILQLIELAVKEGVSNVFKTFDRVERLSPEQSDDGIFNFICRKDVFSVLQTVLRKSLAVQYAVEHAFFKPKPGEFEHHFDLFSFPSSVHCTKLFLYRSFKVASSFTVPSYRSRRRKHFLQVTRSPTNRLSSTLNRTEIFPRMFSFLVLSDARL